MNIISLGAGVQSSTMALMAANGEITPMPDCAIFADTGAEPQYVYEWLKLLTPCLPFPVHTVSDGNIREDILAAVRGEMRSSHLGQPPFYSRGGGRAEGMLFRKCTQHYKIDPIRKKVRELIGLAKGERWKGKDGPEVTQWIGISTDEASRMKPSRNAYIAHRWPLIDAGMSRNDCLAWMMAKGYPAPAKSSCTFCPLHDAKTWRDMKANDPTSFADAVFVDDAIRNGIKAAGANCELYLHRTLVPLADIDFRTAEQAGQSTMFDEECEGMCGV